LSSRRTTTEFNVREGETLVLAGLLTRKNSESIDKVPFLGDLPVLGALFRSKRFQNDETELVVFVTPHIVDSRSPGLVDQVAEATRRLEENLGKPAYLSAPNGPQPGYKPDAAAPVEAASAATVSAESSADEAVPATSAEPRVNQRVNADGVVVYAMPNRLSEVLARPAAGTVVAAASGEAVGGWRQVLLPGGKTGWIGERMLSPTSDAPSSAVNDEEAAASGTGKPVTGQSAAWPVTAQVDAGGAPSAWYRVVTQRLALRVGPDMNAQRIAWLSGGHEVEALSTASVDGWLAVRAGQRKGWVWAQLLEPIHAEEP
jgi:pilus assembly protein CpaC